MSDASLFDLRTVNPRWPVCTISTKSSQIWRGGGRRLCFFFSSRRRHTRFDCDWSSDVCSSDLVNVRVAEAAKWRTVAEWKINNPGHLNRAGVPGHPKRDVQVRPTRLGHALRFTAQMEKMVDFYTRVVGLRLSDRAQDIVAFMRGHGGSDHHVFGFIKSDRPGFHHASFEVGNVDEIGMGACRLLDKGYKDGWGFGRHVIGSNFFPHIPDPSDRLAAYFCG